MFGIVVEQCIPGSLPHARQPTISPHMNPPSKMFDRQTASIEEAETITNLRTCELKWRELSCRTTPQARRYVSSAAVSVLVDEFQCSSRFYTDH